MTLPKRSELKQEQTWSIETVFASESDWRVALEQVRASGAKLSAFKGRLAESGSVLFEALETQNRLKLAARIVVMYPSLQSATEGTNTTYATMLAEAGAAAAGLSAAGAFMKPELLAIPRAALEQMLEQEPRLERYRHALEILQQEQDHVRSNEIETLLAQASDPLGASYSTSNAATDADMKFAPVGDVTISHTSIGELLSSTNATLRKAAWESYADGHLAFQNTLAGTLQGNIKAYVFNMRARGYNSSLEMSLSKNHIPIQVFNNLLEVFKKNLPTWHRYWALRKKAMGGTLHTYDVPIYDSPAPLIASPKMSFWEACETILQGMAPLGERYNSIMRRGLFEERWVDWGQNEGKGAGAFSSGAQGTHPFIFQSWSDDIYSMSTLAHELGHSMHSYLTRVTQPTVYAEYGLFVAEVASNFNQAMVRAYLFKNASSKEQKLQILEEAFSNFHRYLFVMPTLALLERELYERVERGGAVSAPYLSERVNQLFSEGYGGHVTIDVPRLGSAWMNFGHLYAPFYVYQYATGIAAANALAKDVLEQGEERAARYIQFLSAGSSDYPLEVLKIAGIDMNSPEPVERGFEVLKSMVDELETLVG
ncbi:MAG: oligoendopeptidase F [Deinococcales bacterium]